MTKWQLASYLPLVVVASYLPVVVGRESSLVDCWSGSSLLSKRLGELTSLSFPVTTGLKNASLEQFLKPTVICLWLFEANGQIVNKFIITKQKNIMNGKVSDYPKRGRSLQI